MSSAGYFITMIVRFVGGPDGYKNPERLNIQLAVSCLKSAHVSDPTLYFQLLTVPGIQ